MRLLDTFCKAGGTTKGYQRAGFDVVGVDIEPQPHYCGDAFIQADALDVLYALAHGDCWPDQQGRDWHLEDFDAIHASPPCQKFTRAGMQWRKKGKEYPNLIGQTRAALLDIGKPYVIENVVGAPLLNPIMLNGAYFGMRVKRDRLFETSFPIEQPLLPRQEGGQKMDRPWDARNGQLFYPVGHFSGVAEARVVMGIDWYMTQGETAQAIPPAYTEFIGKQLLTALEHAQDTP